MYLFAEIKQLTQYMQSECFFNDFSIMNSAILLKVVSFIVYSWVSSVNSVFLSKLTLYTFYSKERVFSTLYFVFEILLLLRVIVLNIPSKMSQLRKSGSEFYSIEKWHFLQCGDRKVMQTAKPHLLGNATQVCLIPHFGF